MFLFRATHGKVLAGSSSFASQTTTAAGRHIMSNPIRSSERYELTATSATSLNQAPTRAVAVCKHARRLALRGTQRTIVRGGQQEVTTSAVPGARLTTAKWMTSSTATGPISH
jgi:hypothetical protein